MHKLRLLFIALALIFLMAVGSPKFRPWIGFGTQPESLTLSGKTIRDFKPTKPANRYGLVFGNEDQLISIDPVTKRMSNVVSFKIRHLEQIILNADIGEGTIAFSKATKIVRPSNSESEFERAIYVANNASSNPQDSPITARLAKGWRVTQMAWAPDMKSLVVLASKTSRLNQDNPNPYGGPINKVYETVVVDFKRNRLRLMDHFSFEDDETDAIDYRDRPRDHFVLLRWTSSGIVTIIGKRVVKVTPDGRKTVMALKKQPFGSGAISPNGKRIVYETINKAWIINIEPGAKARLVKSPVSSAGPSEPLYEFDYSRIVWISNKRAIMFVWDEKKKVTRVFELISQGKFRLKKIYEDFVGVGPGYKPENAQAAVSPDGKYISTDDGVWDVRNLSERKLSIGSGVKFVGWIALD